jgi:5-methylcytosine-specific restriction endonuclease McrA
MWVRNIGIFAIEHTIPLHVARQYQCTAEHLLAKQDGGKDNKSNIAAACIRCNQGRHRQLVPPSAEQYRNIVRQCVLVTKR